MAKQPHEYLDQTQGIREQLIQNMTANGMPVDNETTGVLLHVLDSMDRSAIGVLRVNAANRTNDLSEQALAIADRLATTVGNPFYGRTIEQSNANAPTPGERIVEIAPVPGHTQIGTETQTYDQFMANIKQ